MQIVVAQFSNAPRLRLSKQPKHHTNMNNNDTTTLEDLQAMREAELEYCYEMEISIEDVNA